MAVADKLNESPDDAFMEARPTTELADALVARMKQNRYGHDACIIGEVKDEPRGIVTMRTGFGGTRIVDMLVAEQLPRIC